MEAPVIVKPIPDQVVNELAAFSPLDLNEYIQAPNSDTKPTFVAEIQGGSALPKGLICTSDGVLTGIPARDTQGSYQFIVTASNEAGSVTATINFTIKPSLSNEEAQYLDNLKSQVWEALDKKLPIPDLQSLYDRPITALEIYYLLERWGILKIWDAFNLDPLGNKVLLTLEGASKHYNVYDRGSCLIAAPKDLFSHERTLEDGLKTARAMAREAYKRDWTIELVGFDKFTRAAWIELRHMGDKFGKYLEVINYEPSHNDLKLYNSQAVNKYDLGLE